MSIASITVNWKKKILLLQALMLLDYFPALNAFTSVSTKKKQLLCSNLYNKYLVLMSSMFFCLASMLEVSYYMFSTFDFPHTAIKKHRNSHNSQLHSIM